MAKIGRNAPCPCGSGRKFKHCHINDPQFNAAAPIVLGDNASQQLIRHWAENQAEFEREYRQPVWAIRQKALSRFAPNTILSTEDSVTVLTQMLQACEAELDALCRGHGRYYLLYLSRRIAPTPIERDSEMTTLLYRTVFTLALLKHGNGNLHELHHVDKLTNQATVKVESATVQPVNLDREMTLRIHQIEYLAHEFNKTTAILRSVWKGGRLRIVSPDEAEVVRSKDVAFLTQLYDDRNQKYGNLLDHFGSFVSLRELELDVADSTLRVICPVLNTGQHEFPLTLPDDPFDAAPFVSNYTLAVLNLRDYYIKLASFRDAIETEHGFSPDEVICFLAALSHRVVRLIVKSFQLRYQLVQRGYWLIGQRAELLQDIAAFYRLYWLHHVGPLPPRQALASVEKVMTALSYSEADLEAISLWDYGPQKLVLDIGESWLVDLSAIPQILQGLFEGFADEAGEIGQQKGREFEDEVERLLSRRLKNFSFWQCHAELAFHDGSTREIDISFTIGNLLFIVECKAFRVSPEFRRGSPKALESRRKRLKEALDAVETLSVKVAEEKGGASFTVPKQVQFVVSLVCSPFPEYAHRIADKYFITATQPRVCTPEELILIAESFDASAHQGKPFLHQVEW